MALSQETDPVITPFFFVRHAPVVKNNGCLPAYDPPIAAGPYPIEALCKILPADADWHISPLQRTMQTADLLRASLRPKTEIFEDALKEQNFGQWHNQDIAAIWPQIKDGPRHNWGFLMPDITPPDGESFDDQVGRVKNWCQRIETQTFLRPQIIFAHGGTIRAALAHILGLSSLHAQSLIIPHFGYLHANLMDAEHAKRHHGGAWQVQALSPI